MGGPRKYSGELGVGRSRRFSTATARSPMSPGIWGIGSPETLRKWVRQSEVARA